MGVVDAEWLGCCMVLAKGYVVGIFVEAGVWNFCKRYAPVKAHARVI
jgi:hypothetical protein